MQMRPEGRPLAAEGFFASQKNLSRTLSAEGSSLDCRDVTFTPKCREVTIRPCPGQSARDQDKVFRPTGGVLNS